MDTKICNICNEEKSLNEFYSQKKKSNKRGEYLYYQPYCKKCVSKKSSEWLYDNIDRKREIDRKYYSTEKGKENYKRKEEYKSEIDYFRNYQQNNLEKFRMYCQRRRSLKNSVESNFTEEDWIKCLDYFNNSCAYCGMTEKEHLEKYKEKLSKNILYL